MYPPVIVCAVTNRNVSRIPQKSPLCPHVSTLEPPPPPSPPQQIVWAQTCLIFAVSCLVQRDVLQLMQTASVRNCGVWSGLDRLNRTAIAALLGFVAVFGDVSCLHVLGDCVVSCNPQRSYNVRSNFCMYCVLCDCDDVLIIRLWQPCGIHSMGKSECQEVSGKSRGIPQCQESGRPAQTFSVNKMANTGLKIYFSKNYVYL